MPEAKVFVSYASSDRALAEQVRSRLRSLPVRIFADQDLRAGDNWADVLRTNLQESDYFLILVTPRTFDSSWVLQELGAAWALGKRVVLVVTDRQLVNKLPVMLKGSPVLMAYELDKLDQVFAERLDPELPGHLEQHGDGLVAAAGGTPTSSAG